MRISQKLEYACRAMVQLAQHHDGQTLIQLDDIAQREAVSANFLVQILNDLKAGGFLESKRGIAGGYRLRRSPDRINLAEVIRQQISEPEGYKDASLGFFQLINDL